jgi:predicted MFS family arabinose efflux permease
MLDVLSSLFLVDIAQTFLGNSELGSIAIVSQIVTISSVAGIVFGILNGFLSTKFDHKKLMLFGASCIVIGALGCFFSPNLLFMMIFYPFDGIGTIIVWAMALTLIGESLPIGQRSKSIGFVTAAGTLSSAVGFSLAGYIAFVGGWRSYISFYILPISLIIFVLIYAVIPSTKSNQQSQTDRGIFLSGFKEVALNRSAMACLFGSMLQTAAGIWSFFAPTFWQKQFLIPVQVAGLITLSLLLVYFTGNIIGSRIVERSGRKRVVIVSWGFRGLLIVATVFMPTFSSALLLSCFVAFAGGIAFTSATCLNVEQVPRSRGTMMSIGGVFTLIGVSLGIATGGIAISQSGFQLLGVTLGVFGVVSTFVISFLAIDPCRE